MKKILIPAFCSLIITCCLASSCAFGNSIEHRADTAKVYYYFWTAKKGTDLAWGENHITSERRLTEKQILPLLLKSMGDKWEYKKQVKIETVVEFNSLLELIEWKGKQDIPRVAYQILINRKQY